MTSYQQGDLLLVAFPYAEGTQRRTRPGLVILDTGNADVVVARVTTQMYQTMHDVTLTHWREGGLLAPSVVRTHKLATIEKALVRRKLGRLRSADRERVSAVMQQTYAGWGIGSVSDQGGA
jgi:mRNA interferase MazF